MDIEKLAQNLTNSFIDATPGFTINVFPNNIEKAKGCKVRPQSPCAGEKVTHFFECGTYNYDVERSKKIEGYCREFLETLQKTYPPQAERFADKLSGIQIKMGIHKTTFAEVRRAIKDRFQELRERKSGDKAYFSMEGFEGFVPIQEDKRKETKYKTELGVKSAIEMIKTGSDGLSFSREGCVQVIGGSNRHTLFHELIHQMTTRTDNVGRTVVGFETYFHAWDNNTNKYEWELFGRGINEGMTEKTEVELFNGNKRFSAYTEFQAPLDVIELCIGKEKLRQAFFQCDVSQIFESFPFMDKSKEDFIAFIRSLDFIYDNYEDGDYREKDQVALKNQIFHEVGNYLTQMFSKTLVYEITQARENNYTPEQLQALQQSQRERVEKFYKLMNQKFGKYKYASNETLQMLREEINNATKERAR